MRGLRITVTTIALSCLLCVAITPSASAQTTMQQQLDALAEAEALERLLTEAESATQTNALSNLTSRLVRAGLVPRIQLNKGAFEGGVFRGLALFSAPVSFYASSQFGAIVRGVGQALASTKGTLTRVCFLAPGGTSESFRINKSGEDVLFSALSNDLSSEDIAPIPMHIARIDGRVRELSYSTLGKGLYQAIRRQAKRGNEVIIRMSPLPKSEPVRLTLKTTQGEKLTFPVELNGAKQTVKIGKRARWTVNGRRVDALVDLKKPGQRLLIEAMMRKPSVKLAGIELADYYPTRTWEPEQDPADMQFGESDPLRYVFHLLGPRNNWFDSVTFQVKPRVSIKRTAGDCGLEVSVTPLNKKMLSLGARPLSVWKTLERAKAVSSSAPQPVIGYLDPPRCASTTTGLTDAEFDRTLTE